MNANFSRRHFIFYANFAVILILSATQTAGAHQAPHNPWAQSQASQQLNYYGRYEADTVSRQPLHQDNHRHQAGRFSNYSEDVYRGLYPVYRPMHAPYADPLIWDMNSYLSPYLSLHPVNYNGFDGIYSGIYRPYLPFLYRGW